jgi:hypothetical protein
MPGAVPVRSPSPGAIALEQRVVDGAGRTGLEDHGGLDACSGVSLLHRVPT